MILIFHLVGQLGEALLSIHVHQLAHVMSLKFMRTVAAHDAVVDGTEGEVVGEK